MSVLLIWGEMKTFTLTYRLVLHGISIFNVENRASYLSVVIKAKLLTLQRSHLFTAADSSPQRPCIAKKTCFLMIFDRGSHWFLKLKHACVWHKNKPNCLLWVMNKLQSFHSPYVCAHACTLINVYMFKELLLNWRHGLPMEGQKSLKFHETNLHLCFERWTEVWLVWTDLRTSKWWWRFLVQ